MDPIKITLHDFGPGNTATAHFEAVLNILLNSDLKLGNVKRINCLQEDLTVDLSFLDDILRGPNTIFSILRDYLV